MNKVKHLFPLLIFLSACHSSKMVITDPKITFDKQGHRGCRGLMPENTIPAMLKAIDLGVNTLEMDVVFTADKVAILSHEPYFNSEITTYPPSILLNEEERKLFNIYKMPYIATQRFDVGSKPHPRFPKQEKMKVFKPSLVSVIDSVEAYLTQKNLPKVLYNIETKTRPETDNIFHPAPAAFVDLLMKVIKERGIEDRVIIQSFDRRTLQYLHKNFPDVKTALLVEGNDRNSFRKQINDLGFTPTIYSPEETLVTQNLVNECHEKGMKIIPWTVNSKERLRALKKSGVDGLISDFPDLL